MRKATHFVVLGHILQVMTLLSKTNRDWWNVRKSNGREGFVPANYVKEVEPKVIQRIVKKPVKVSETVKVKKTVYEKQPVPKLPKKKNKGKGIRRTPSGKYRDCKS
jgi:spectrin beta